MSKKNLPFLQGRPWTCLITATDLFNTATCSLISYAAGISFQTAAFDKGFVAIDFLKLPMIFNFC